MARKKLTLNKFKQSIIGAKEQKAVKGGYKTGPSGASHISSLIWESVDVRDSHNAGGEKGTKNYSFRPHGR